MTQPAPIDIAVHRLVERRRWRSRHDRGYATDGNELFLNGHLIAHWWKGAVRMYHQDTKWVSWMYANATHRVSERLREAGVLADRDERVCYEHVDCRACPELGKACGEQQWAPAPMPYFEKQAARRLARASGE